MKKLLFFISLFIFFIVPVKADTIIQEIDNSHTDLFTDYNSFYNSVVLPHINDYSYYAVNFDSSSTPYVANVYFFNTFVGLTFDISGNYLYSGFLINNGLFCDSENQCSSFTTQNFFPLTVGRSPDIYYRLYDTNYNLINTISPLSLTGFYSDDIFIDIDDSFPTLKNLYQYSSWSEYENNHLEGYAEVNLDNYDYVLLTLKDYTQKNAFQTNFQVKGQIGITPIYNYGQTSKDSITGAQVQDRCNVTYNNYTAYPFYILQTDLQNNVIYAVKECESGSSFKYDTNIFDITYVTAQNADNPTVTINGHTYDVIPYDDLPSTATKNEEDNYIPGESYNFVDAGIDSLSTAIKSLQQGLSNLWNTFTYFTSFVGLIFSSLPVELRTILLSAFVVAITIGLIKLFTN